MPARASSRSRSKRCCSPRRRARSSSSRFRAAHSPASSAPALPVLSRARRRPLTAAQEPLDLLFQAPTLAIDPARLRALPSSTIRARHPVCVSSTSGDVSPSDRAHGASAAWRSSSRPAKSHVDSDGPCRSRAHGSRPRPGSLGPPLPDDASITATPDPRSPGDAMLT